MKFITNLFDNIGRVITSLGAVIFVMLMTITGMVFFSHTLFNEVFPASMETWEKFAATWVMALGWELTVLITTVNAKPETRHIPLVMAVASGIIVLFFIEAFDATQPFLTLCQRWLVGIIAATINYLYAGLFYTKWKERNDRQELPMKLVQTESELIQLRSTVNELQSDLNERQSRFIQVERELDELRRFKRQIDSELTCPHCKQPQKAFGTLHAHKGHCSENPKNKVVA